MSKELLTTSTMDSKDINLELDYLKDMVQKDFVHIKTGGVYTVIDFIWNAETDEWSIHYMRKDRVGFKFSRSVTNFLYDGDKPRFVKLDYGTWKPDYFNRSGSAGVGGTTASGIPGSAGVASGACCGENR